MKIAYVNFVNHCYVDTEVEMKEIYTSNHIWNLFENFLVDMARVRILAWLKRNLFYLFVDFGLCAHVYMVVRCVFCFFPLPSGVQRHHGQK